MDPTTVIRNGLVRIGPYLVTPRMRELMEAGMPSHQALEVCRARSSTGGVVRGAADAA